MVLFVIGSCPSHHGVRLALADQCQRRRDRRKPPGRQPQLRPHRATVPAGTARLTLTRENPVLSDPLHLFYAPTTGAPKSVSSIHMRCSTTNSRDTMPI